MPAAKITSVASISVFFLRHENKLIWIFGIRNWEFGIRFIHILQIPNSEFPIPLLQFLYYMISPLIPSAITLDDISHLAGGEVKITVLRLDKLHQQISGNKWFKLRYYLEEAKAMNKKNIVTFGGAWSNHLLATAAASQLYGFNSTGIIRGEEPAELSSTLASVKELGMKLVFSSREQYREKYIPSELLSAEDYLIPEGGYGEKGAKGAATILEHCPNDFTH